MDNKYTHEEVKAKLQTGKYYLKSLPSYQATNFGMFFSKQHDKYYRSSVHNNRDTIGDIYDISHEEIDAFLVQTSHTDGYKEYHFDEIVNMHESLHQLEDLVAQAESILVELEENRSFSFRLPYLGFYIMCLDMFDWYAISEKENGDYYEFMMNSNRARKEIVNVLQENPSETAKEQLPAVAQARWESVVDWVAKHFPHGRKPGVYYLVNDTTVISYLSNCQPIEITYNKQDKYVNSILQNLKSKHRDYLKELLQTPCRIEVLQNAAHAALQGWEYLDLDAIFKADAILKGLNEDKLRMECGPFHQSNYGVTADKKFLHSHTLDKDYPIVKTLTSLLEKGGAINLYGFERFTFPNGLKPTDKPEPLFMSALSEGGTADVDIETAHQHVEAPIIKARPYEITQKWDLKIIKAQCHLVDHSINELKLLEIDVALHLHEAITSVSLTYKGKESLEGRVVSTYGLGSRVLTSSALENAGIITTIWDFQSFPDEVMVTLKTILDTNTGLTIEINAFVEDSVFDKITGCLDEVLYQ